MNKELIEKIYNDYWSKNNEGKWKINVGEIIKKYGLDIQKGNLADWLIENGFRKKIESCKFCGKDVFQKSRGSWYSGCSCGYQGICDCCNKPYRKSMEWEEWNNNGEWMVKKYCYKCWISLYNQEQESKEKKVKEINPIITDEERKILICFKYYRDKIFANDFLDFAEVGFLLKKSPHYCEKLFDKQIAKKGYIEHRAYLSEDEEVKWLMGEIIVKGIRKIKLGQDTVFSLIPSDIAKNIYKQLEDKYPKVFVEVPPSAFINSEKVMEELDYQEKKWFFTTRFDFVCSDKKFVPITIIEYNGSHHFYKNHNDYEKRKFKRKICELVGLKLIEINSFNQIIKRIKEARVK